MGSVDRGTKVRLMLALIQEAKGIADEAVAAAEAIETRRRGQIVEQWLAGPEIRPKRTREAS